MGSSNRNGQNAQAAKQSSNNGIISMNDVQSPGRGSDAIPDKNIGMFASGKEQSVNKQSNEKGSQRSSK